MMRSHVAHGGWILWIAALLLPSWAACAAGGRVSESFTVPLSAVLAEEDLVGAVAVEVPSVRGVGPLPA